MTHTSTEQPVALLKLAHYNDDHLTREEIDVLRDAALEIRLLRARVQELEAAQAREPLSEAQIEAAMIEAQLPQYDICDSDLQEFARCIEAAHGITQEKQG